MIENHRRSSRIQDISIREHPVYEYMVVVVT